MTNRDEYIGWLKGLREGLMTQVREIDEEIREEEAKKAKREEVLTELERLKSLAEAGDDEAARKYIRLLTLEST